MKNQGFQKGLLIRIENEGQEAQVKEHQAGEALIQCGCAVGPDEGEGQEDQDEKDVRNNITSFLEINEGPADDDEGRFWGEL